MRDNKRIVTLNGDIETGIRCGEMQGLHWSDVNWSKKTITVWTSMDYHKDEKRFVENPPKTKNGYRTIPLTAEAIDILKARLRHTFATRVIEAGMPPKTLQKILGHSTLAMTMDLYVHVTDDSLISGMDVFEKYDKDCESGRELCD